jgi:hypothetical protein
VQAMVDRIDGELVAAQPADRLVRICARGFAAHLLGDSFAHSQLHSPGRRYPPGTGHWKDNHDPDYLLAREILKIEAGHSSRWFESASSILKQRLPPAMLAAQAQQALQSHKSEPGHDYSEVRLTAALIAHAPPGWQAFTPQLQEWRPSGMDGIFLQTKCDDQLSKAFPQPGERPACAAVWRYYLGIAMPAFKEAGLDPVDNAGYGKGCAGDGDELKNGEN